MLKIYIILTLLVAPSIAMSQGLVFEGGDDMNRGTGLIEITPVVLNESYIGSPYLTDEFTLIRLNKIEGETFKARYNAHDDTMEVIGEDGKYYNLVRDLDLDVNFILTNQNYRVFNYEKNSDKNGYFVVLNDSEIKLIKKEIIAFQDEVVAKTGYDKAQPAKFKREKDKFYFQMNDGNLIEIPKNKNNFISLLQFDSDKSDKVLSYIKKNRIKLNVEQDLRDLFVYLNSNTM